MLSLTLEELEADLALVRAAATASDSAAERIPRPDLTAVTREVVLVRQLGLLDDLAASRARRAAPASVALAGEDSTLMAMRGLAVARLRELRSVGGGGSGVWDKHDDDTVAPYATAAPPPTTVERRSVVDHFTAACARVRDAEDESR